MIRLGLVAVASAALSLVAASVGARGQEPENPTRAHVNWMLKCQGCHQPDGNTEARTAPPLAGHVARFLSVPGGREYLGRVPGVATATLDDAQLAELLNWTLSHFDARDMPARFQPYTASEIGALRKNTFHGGEAAAFRNHLLAENEPHGGPATEEAGANGKDDQ
jgi:mono/diheme cytochrome c family protein